MDHDERDGRYRPDATHTDIVSERVSEDRPGGKRRHRFASVTAESRDIHYRAGIAPFSRPGSDFAPPKRDQYATKSTPKHYRRFGGTEGSSSPGIAGRAKWKESVQ